MKKPLKFSKNVRHGALLTKRGDKFICARKGLRYKSLAGVYNNKSFISVISSNDGEIYHFNIPAGVRITGESVARITKEGEFVCI